MYVRHSLMERNAAEVEGLYTASQKPGLFVHKRPARSIFAILSLLDMADTFTASGVSARPKKEGRGDGSLDPLDMALGRTTPGPKTGELIPVLFFSFRPIVQWVQFHVLTKHSLAQEKNPVNSFFLDI